MKKCLQEGCNYNVFSHKYCKKHQYLRKDDNVKDNTIKKTPLKRNYKPTGEGILFDTIIATREHKSFISGIKINNISHSNMAHVLNKKKYPLFRLYEKNIVILHNSYPYLEHHLFDNGTEEQREKYAKEYGADWNKLYKLKEELLNEYNNLKT